VTLAKLCYSPLKVGQSTPVCCCSRWSFIFARFFFVASLIDWQTDNRIKGSSPTWPKGKKKGSFGPIQLDIDQSIWPCQFISFLAHRSGHYIWSVMARTSARNTGFFWPTSHFNGLEVNGKRMARQIQLKSLSRKVQLSCLRREFFTLLFLGIYSCYFLLLPVLYSSPLFWLIKFAKAFAWTTVSF